MNIIKNNYMNEEMKTGAAEASIWPLALRNGLIAGLVLIALGLILQMTGLVDPSQPQQGMSLGGVLSSLLNIVVMAGAAVMAVREYRGNTYGGFITLGKAFKLSMAVFLIISVLTVLWTLLYMGVINPDMVEIIREQALEQASERSGGELPEEAETMVGMLTNLRFFAISAFFGTMLLGLLIAFFVGLVMKKEPHSPAV